MRMRVDVTIFLVQLLFQLAELNFVFPEERPLVDIFVNASLIFDFLSPGSELEGGDALTKALGRGTDHGHHGGLAVATERVLEEACEFGVTVGDVRAGTLVCQGGDHVAQAGQRLVDFLRFLKTFPSGSSDSDTFRPGQIHEIQFADLDLFRRIIIDVVVGVLVIILGGCRTGRHRCHLFDDDDENGVRT